MAHTTTEADIEQPVTFLIINLVEDGSASLGAASAIGWSAAGVTFNRDRHSNVPQFPQYVAGGSQPIPRVQNYVTFTDPASVALTMGRYINTSASHMNILQG